MNIDRANEIISEEARKTLQLMEASDSELQELMAMNSYPTSTLEVLMGCPADVRSDSVRMMEAIVAGMEAFQRKENRVIDGRAGIIALDLLSLQQYEIQRRISDEDVGPHGPHKN